jgi:16S rRNA C967 or C1407 C5-methylase (RsmB/RsmF family)
MYSTCTLAPEENEAVVHMLLSLYPDLELQDIDIDYKYLKN